MAVATTGTSSNYLQRAPSPSGLADVLDLILDKGLVIDAYVRIAVIGIELVTIDARIVIASVDTYLRFAEAVNRLDLTQTEPSGLPERRQRRHRLPRTQGAGADPREGRAEAQGERQRDRRDRQGQGRRDGVDRLGRRRDFAAERRHPDGRTEAFDKGARARAAGAR